MYHRGIYYNVILLDDTGGIPGSVCKNPDDSYTIFIDANLNEYQQRKVFRHEIRHIKQNDFEKGNVQEIEKETHDD